MEKGLGGLIRATKNALYAIAERVPQRLLPVGVKLRMLIRSGVLDYSWYRHTTLQLPRNDLELAAGVFSDDRERVGNPLFSADYYRLAYKFNGSPGEALLHYVLVGERRGYKPCEWFDPAFFRAHNPDAPPDGVALAHFLREWRRFPMAHPYFDAEWYCTRYPDVAEAGHNPLVHFANWGPKEGREPNAFFNSRWYLAQNADIASAGLAAAEHFEKFGAIELRNPGPNFDMRRYAARFGHYAETGLDPLAHYLTFGRKEGLDLGRLCLTFDDFALPARARRTVNDWAVDVVVPVYRNVQETRRCLESVLASRLPANARVLVYNDQSPEPAMTEYLRELDATGRILLRENETNLGFVGTVNRAMRESLADGRRQAVLLLNSDTEVANDWVQRLCAHAAADDTVGSVTALSNNATICSYPHMGANDFPAETTVAEVDALTAEVNRGVAVEIPTAVGFCMLIPVRALREVGLFDEDAFGKGYGEENDFCLRAAAQGYHHLLATDVFVRHVGEVSFGSTSNPGKENAARIILARYPDYNTMVARHVGADPALVARTRLTFALWKRDRKPVVALVTHDVGGGTEQQVGEVCKALAGDHHVLVVKPVAGNDERIVVENRDKFDAFEMVLDIGGPAGFAGFLELAGVTQVQVHHLLGFGPVIRRGLAQAGVPHEFHIHDYYTVCPQVSLTSAEHEYCGEPDAHGCNACIARRPSNGSSDIVNWRLTHDWVVLGATRVIAPSRDAAARMRRYHDVDVDVVPHEPSVAIGPPRPIVRRPTASEPLRVVVLGVLAPHKGKYKVLQALKAIAEMQLPLHVHLIGYLGLTDGEMSEAMGANFTSTGWYEEKELDDLIQAARPDLFLFASTAPETYSFTLTRALRSGLPIVAPAHGAFQERLAGYPTHWLYDTSIDGADLAQRIFQYASHLVPVAGGRHAAD
jgi:GT2 family glycosyltransferase/glycosyltransferase involved in cell wall biosynthesis